MKLEAAVDEEGTQPVPRLASPLLPNEVLEVEDGVSIDATPEGVRLQTAHVESEVDGVSVAEMRTIFAALDGRSTIREACSALASVLDEETLVGIFEALVGDVLRLRWQPTGPERNIIVVDDFFDDADDRRAEALVAKYRAIDWFLFPGLFSTSPPANIERTMQRLEETVGHELVWGDGPIHGRYRYSSEDHRRRAGANVHVDPFGFNAVVCLTPTDLCIGGISFYRHRATGLFGRDAASLRSSGLRDVELIAKVDALVAEDGPHIDRWQEVDRVDLRYNRLVCFNPRLFHRTNAQFGDRPENGRLTQTFSSYAPNDPFRYGPWA